MSRRQASFCLYALPTISIRHEETRTPPLHFRRRPPQSNYPPDTVSCPVYGSRLDFQTDKGGISRMTPLKLASQLQNLPPILHKSIRKSMSSYSKGARGLSVRSREAGIFTGTTNSLSLSLRQRPTRYAIHARRNLPDKVLRYLRTVIVTAAVYWGFDSKLAPLLLTFQHRAGVRPYTSSSEFAEPCVFVKQSPPPGLCHPLMVAHREVLLIPKLRR